MAEIARKRREVTVDRHSLPLPVDERANGKTVAEIVHARTYRRGAKSERRGDLAEGLVDARTIQCRADRRAEEDVCTRPCTQSVTCRCIDRERSGGAVVEGHEPRAVELRVADRDHAGLEVDVGASEAGRLTDPHAGHRKQAEQRLMGRRAKRWRESSGGLKHPLDVGFGEQVRGRSVPLRRKDARRWHLGDGVDRREIDGEAAHDSEALGPMVGGGRDRQLCPSDREFACEVLFAGSFGVADELCEQLLLALELEAERAPQCQVLLDVSAKGAHLTAPGHGAASPRSVSRSTRA